MASSTPVLKPATATNGDDILIGSQLYDQIFSKGGSDSVTGLAGDDELYGEGQDDTLDGGTGDDFVHGGSGDDFLYGRDGNDTLDGSLNDDWLFGGGEDDTLWGGGGSDHIFGGGETDTILHNEGDGSDVIDGGSGDDLLSLFTSDAFGEDVFLGENFVLSSTGAEAVLERNSEDPFILRISNTENLELFTFGGADALTVGDLTGSGISSIVMFGGDGTERVANEGFTPMQVFGEAGNDFLFGGGGDDRIGGGEDRDFISGGSGNDAVLGDDGDDTLFGSDGEDSIEGGTGNDQLIGGFGNDVLTGGEGFDQFRYDLPLVAGGNDTILDFSLGDELFIGGITQAALDTSGDGILSDADDAVSFNLSDLVVSFDPDNSLTLVGITSLDLSSDVIFV